MRLPDQNELTDALRRDQLTPQQQAELQLYLAQHSEERGLWEEELSLNQLLRQVPDAPVSSNFTARVLEAARQHTHRGAAPGQSLWERLNLRRWVPTAATASAVLGLALFSYHQNQVSTRRELARNLAEISRFAAEDSLELLRNFNAIEQLNQVPRNVDRDLLAALQ